MSYKKGAINYLLALTLMARGWLLRSSLTWKYFASEYNCA